MAACSSVFCFFQRTRKGIKCIKKRISRASAEVRLLEHGLHFAPSHSRAYVHVRHIGPDGAILGLGSRNKGITHETTGIGACIGLGLIRSFFQWCVFHKSP